MALVSHFACFSVSISSFSLRVYVSHNHSAQISKRKTRKEKKDETRSTCFRSGTFQGRLNVKIKRKEKKKRKLEKKKKRLKRMKNKMNEIIDLCVNVPSSLKGTDRLVRVGSRSRSRGRLPVSHSHVKRYSTFKQHIYKLLSSYYIS